MSLIVLGTVALDNVKTPYGSRKNLLGGSATHCAISARLFTDVGIVGVVGKDFPNRHLDLLKRKKIDLNSLEIVKGETFRWTGQYSGAMNEAQTLCTKLGVLPSFKPKITSQQRHAKYVFLANVDPDAQSHLIDLMHSPKLIGLDSMNFWINNARKKILKLLKRVDIYFANDQEARDLSGEHNLIKAAKKLKILGPKMVVIKKGEHGVLFYGSNFMFLIPGFPIDQVIDPTGAGDTFAGAFMGYLTCVNKFDQHTLRRAVCYGVSVSSFNVQGFGSERTEKLKLEQVKNRIQEFRKLVKF